MDNIPIAVIGTNARLRLPDRIMALLNLKEGDQLAFLLVDDQVVLRKLTEIIKPLEEITGAPKTR